MDGEDSVTPAESARLKTIVEKCHSMSESLELIINQVGVRRNADVTQAERLLEDFDAENILARELLATLEDRRILAKDEAKSRRTVIERSLPSLKTPPFDGNRENLFL